MVYFTTRSYVHYSQVRSFCISVMNSMYSLKWLSPALDQSTFYNQASSYRDNSVSVVDVVVGNGFNILQYNTDVWWEN